MMWCFGGWLWFNNIPYVGGQPRSETTPCYGDPPLAGAEGGSSKSALEVLREIDAQETARRPNASPDPLEPSVQRYIGRPCTPAELQNQINAYNGRVAWFVVSIFVVLSAPLFVAAMFVGIRRVIAWVWQGFAPQRDRTAQDR